MPAVEIRLRQQAPFRYVDEVTAIDRHHRCARGRARPSQAAARFGNVDGCLPGYLVVEGLAQLSGVLLRELGLVRPGELGYLVSVSDAWPAREFYDDEQLLLTSRLACEAGGIFQFECCFTAGDGASGQMSIGIGVRHAS